MTVFGVSSCFVLFAVSVFFEVLAHTSVESCGCYYCNVSNVTGTCLNSTACNLPASSYNVSLTATSSDSQPFYSCDANCNIVYILSGCGGSPITFEPVNKPVAIICAVAGTSAVAVLGLIAVLAFHRAKRMEKRKKGPLPMLPTSADMDVSIRTSPTTGQLAIPASQSNADCVSDCEQPVLATSPTPSSSTNHSQNRCQYKEDWIIPMGPSSAKTPSPSPSCLDTDKSNDRATIQTQPTYTNVGPTSEETDQNYVNVEGLTNDEDEDNSPDYVNTRRRSSADDDDLDYVNVDDSVTTARETTTVPKISIVQENSPVTAQSKGLTRTAPGKAVSSDWLASISAEEAAPMDSEYIDMTGKSKVKLKSMLSLKFRSKASAIFASAPDVRMKGKGQPFGPVYVNHVPAVPRKPKTRTVKDLLSTTN